MNQTRFLTLLLFGIPLAIASAAEAPRLLPFQGHLTDSAGKPVPDGARTILFQIYGEPVGGTVLWAGEVHRTTVNGGLVNVLLGAKNPLPRNRADDPQRPFFDANLYLQVTVDNNTNNRIDPEDPPLLPRQSIVSPVFAQESGNAGKLAGRDWSDLLDSPDPRTGKLSGDRIKTASIGSDQLGRDAVTGDKLRDGAVTESKLGPGAVSRRSLGNGSVGLSNLSPEVASQLGKTFTGKPESIIRLGSGENFTIPAGKWALVKAQMYCNYVYEQWRDSEATSYDAYAFSGDKIALISGGAKVPHARLDIREKTVAELYLPYIGPNGNWNSSAGVFASIYLYPDQ